MGNFNWFNLLWIYPLIGYSVALLLSLLIKWNVVDDEGIINDKETVMLTVTFWFVVVIYYVIKLPLIIKGDKQ